MSLSKVRFVEWCNSAENGEERRCYATVSLQSDGSWDLKWRPSKKWDTDQVAEGRKTDDGDFSSCLNLFLLSKKGVMSFVHILLHHLRLCSFNVPNETSLLVSPLCFGPLSKRIKTGVPKWLASNWGKVMNQGDANPCKEGNVNTREESVQSPADPGKF